MTKDMIKDIPDIEFLTEGINDTDLLTADGIPNVEKLNALGIGEPKSDEKSAPKERTEQKVEVEAEEKSEAKESVAADKSVEVVETVENEKSAETKPTNDKKSMTTPQPKTKAAEKKQRCSNPEQDQCWVKFLSHLQDKEETAKLHRRDYPIIRLNPSLASTLDQCNLNSRCRSDVVNAIVASFIETYMGQLLPYRTKVPPTTMFENLKSAQQ